MKLLQFGIEDLYMLVLLNQGMTVTAAAKKMHLSQAALSLRLAKLNRILDVRMQGRFGRHIRLTPAGVKLAEASLLALKILELAVPVVPVGKPIYSVEEPGKMPH